MFIGRSKADIVWTFKPASKEQVNNMSMPLVMKFIVEVARTRTSECSQTESWAIMDFFLIKRWIVSQATDWKSREQI